MNDMFPDKTMTFRHMTSVFCPLHVLLDFTFSPVRKVGLSQFRLSTFRGTFDLKKSLNVLECPQMSPNVLFLSAPSYDIMYTVKKG